MRLKNFVLAVAAALALAVAITPAARNVNAAAAVKGEDQVFTHEAGGISFTLPTGWKAEPDGEQITVAPTDGGISISFWAAEDEDFEAASEALGEELGKQIKNLKLDGEPKEGTHNGMQYAAVTGSGQLDGQDIVFSADLLAARKPVIILSFGTAEGLRKYAGEYSQLVNSIKKVA